jgi:hypothetical protein
MQRHDDYEMTTRNKAILIARLLRAVGFNLMATYAERETCDTMLSGYLRIAEVKAKNNPEALAEAYYFGLLDIPLTSIEGLAQCPF